MGLVSHWLVAYSGSVPLFAVAWLAPFRMRLWQALLLTVLAAGGFMLVSFAAGLPSTAIFGIGAGLGWSVYFAAVLNNLATTKRHTAVVAAARAGEAVLAERQRMTREIHDILAHSLAAQVVHLEGTQVLLERDADRGQALERVRQAGELAGLAENVRTTTGNPCAVTVDGDPDELAPEVRLAVVRTAQEALTNVHKHAPDTEITISLRCGDSGCELDVRNSGDGGTGSDTNTGGALASTGSGYGLVGMRERAELAGGSLDTGPDGSGFRVLLRMPSS